MLKKVFVLKQETNSDHENSNRHYYQNPSENAVSVVQDNFNYTFQTRYFKVKPSFSEAREGRTS